MLNFLFPGLVISKVLQVLEILDRHNFDKVDTISPIDLLYNKVFGVLQCTDSNEVGSTLHNIMFKSCIQQTYTYCPHFLLNKSKLSAGIAYYTQR